SSSPTSCGCGRFSRLCPSRWSNGTTSCGCRAGVERPSGRFVEDGALGVAPGACPGVESRFESVTHPVEAAREPGVDGAQKNAQPVEQFGEVPGYEGISEEIDGGHEPVFDEHDLD